MLSVGRNWKWLLGLLLLAGSYAPMLMPRRIFTHPVSHFHGYPIVAGNVLAIAATLCALGLILVSEGVCERLGAPSLADWATRSGRQLASVVIGAAVAGLTMEFFAQWLSKLWFYPYWTLWFYWLVLLPGFVLYWLAIAETYVAVKALLDSVALSRLRGGRAPLALILAVLGAILLGVAAWRYASWYLDHGGYVFAITKPVPSAPPFLDVILAFIGALLLAEWALHRQGRPSLLGSLFAGYRIPVAAVLVSSALTALVTESQNAVNRYWTYAHFPKASAAFLGVPLTVYATWPLQYLAFLLIPSLFVPALATLFWSRQGAPVNSGETVARSG